MKAQASEATVLFGKRGYRNDSDGYPIASSAQLTDAVSSHVLKYHANFNFDGEPLVFGEDPREGGDSEDDTDAPSKELREVEKLKGKLDSARRGDAGEANPYFVLVTRRLSLRWTLRRVLLPMCKVKTINACGDPFIRNSFLLFPPFLAQPSFGFVN